jgi:hypothetical protein
METDPQSSEKFTIVNNSSHKRESGPNVPSYGIEPYLPDMVKHYNKHFNTNFTLTIEPTDKGIAIGDGNLFIGKYNSDNFRNTSLKMLHEIGHEFLRNNLLGIQRTSEMFTATVYQPEPKPVIDMKFVEFVDPILSKFIGTYLERINDALRRVQEKKPISATPLGARDWTENGFSMPPFDIHDKTHARLIGKLFNTEEKQVIFHIGIRDIFCDAFAIEHGKHIYLTPEEREQDADPFEVLINQILNEIEANLPLESDSFYKGSSKNYTHINQIARFGALCQTGNDVFEGSPEFLYLVGKYDRQVERIYGKKSFEYQAYRALQSEYAQYMRDCLLGRDNVRLMAELQKGGAYEKLATLPFIDGSATVENLSELIKQSQKENNPAVKIAELIAIEEIAKANFDSRQGRDAMLYLVRQNDPSQVKRIIDFLGSADIAYIEDTQKILEAVNVAELEQTILRLGSQDPFAVEQLIHLQARLDTPFASIDQIADIAHNVALSNSSTLGKTASLLCSIGEHKPFATWSLIRTMLQSEDVNIRVSGIQALSELGMGDPESTIVEFQKLYTKHDESTGQFLSPDTFWMIYAVGQISIALEQNDKKISPSVISFYNELLGRHNMILSLWIMNNLVGLKTEGNMEIRQLLNREFISIVPTVLDFPWQDSEDHRSTTIARQAWGNIVFSKIADYQLSIENAMPLLEIGKYPFNERPYTLLAIRNPIQAFAFFDIGIWVGLMIISVSISSIPL